MDGRSTGSDPEYRGVGPESNDLGPPPTTDLNTSTLLSSPSTKRSRRSVQKRVVSVPSGDGAAPPSDSWTWRKYGQKPIKGSPYPRGYYRCSCYKGCPARKQVERSCVDPTMLVITYAGEHNHPWPLPRNPHQRAMLRSVETPTPHQEPAAATSGPTGPADQAENFADLIVDESSSLVTPEDFYWLSAVGSTLYGPVCGAGADVPAAGVAMMFADECERLSGDGCGGGREEDPLFADLGELPECSAVFRRGFVERNLRGQENRRCTLTAAGCCGTTG